MEVYQLDQELLQVSSVEILHSGVLFVTVVRFSLFSLLVLLALHVGYFLSKTLFQLVFSSFQFFQGIRQRGTETNNRLQFCVGCDFCVLCVQHFKNNILSMSFSCFTSIDVLCI